MFDRLRKTYTFGTTQAGQQVAGSDAQPHGASAAGSPGGTFSLSKVGGFVTGLGKSLVPRVREGSEGDEQHGGGGRGGMGVSRFDLFFGRDDDETPTVASGNHYQPHRPLPAVASRKGKEAGQVEACMEVLLQEPTTLEFEEVFGRLVLKNKSATDNMGLRGVSTGSVLVAVDGETLTPENYNRLLEKLRVWTISSVDEGEDEEDAAEIASDPPVLKVLDEEGQKVPEEGSMEGKRVAPVVLDNGAEQDAVPLTADDSAVPLTLPGSIEPSKPDELVEDGEPSLGPALALADHDVEPLPAPPSPLPPSPHAALRLTFRLLSPDQDVEDAFPLVPHHSPVSLRKGHVPSEEERLEAHRELVAKLKVIMEQPDLPDRLIEHFLAMNGNDMNKAVEQFKGIREEARELLAAYENDGSEASCGEDSDEPGEEEEDEPLDPLASSSTTTALTWDSESEGLDAEDFPMFEASTSASPADPPRTPRAAEFEVVITEQQRLGITVENVLERTVICTVSRTSCAFRAGVEEGCLVVGLNEMNTRSMCHKEVIDRLQQPHRPLRMRLRRVAPEKLEQRRNEMIALMHPHGIVATGENSLESRAAMVAWAEQRLLLLVRLLAIGATLEGPERGAFSEGPAHVRLLDILSSIQTNFKKREGRVPGVNDRLRTMGQELSSLVDLFEDIEWKERVLAAGRWHFIDMVCQVLCVDSEAALTTTRDTRDLTDGPAIVLLQEMVRRLRGSQVRDNVNLLLYRLAGSYSIHARIACCALIPLVYGRMPQPQQLQVRGILTRFMTEEIPMVRSVVIQTMSDLTPFVDIHSIKWLFFMLETSSKDSPHRTRNKILEICYRVALALRRASEQHSNTPSVSQELHLMKCKLLPFVNIAADDSDWQVRAAFAFFCPGFVDCFGEHWATVFIDNLEALMRDSEVMVRRLAVDSIPKIADTWLQQAQPASASLDPASDASKAALNSAKKKVLDQLVPGFVRLVMDPSVEVRVAVAAAVGKLLKLLARRKDEDNHDPQLDNKLVQVMTPLMQRILHDDSPADVALAMLEGMRMDEDLLRGETLSVTSTLAGSRTPGQSTTDPADPSAPDKAADAPPSDCNGQASSGDALAASTSSPLPPTSKRPTSSSALLLRRRKPRGPSASPPLTLVDSQVDLLLPAIMHLASNHAWRLRKAVIQCLPTIQVLVLPGHRLDASLQQLWTRLLNDPVEIVRRCAGEYLCLSGRLLSALGGEGAQWTNLRVLPRCRDCISAPNFKQRQLGLHMAQTLISCHAFSPQTLSTEVVPLLLLGAQDKLANVRLVVPAVLESVSWQLWEAGLHDDPRVKGTLLTLLEDKDRDVRYYARQAHVALGYGQAPSTSPVKASVEATAEPQDASTVPAPPEVPTEESDPAEADDGLVDAQGGDQLDEG